jgi:hypothetical protein
MKVLKNIVWVCTIIVVSINAGCKKLIEVTRQPIVLSLVFTTIWERIPFILGRNRSK